MTREEKCKLLIEKGYTYDEVSGQIYNRFGKEITSKVKGYISVGQKDFQLKGHQFAYYYKYGKVVDCIDHINGIKDDNRICNLREVTHQQNQHNQKNAKGYYHNGYSYCSKIALNGKSIYLGSFDTEEEASQAYLEAKEKYHLI